MSDSTVMSVACLGLVLPCSAETVRCLWLLSLAYSLHSGVSCSAEATHSSLSPFNPHIIVWPLHAGSVFNAVMNNQS